MDIQNIKDTLSKSGWVSFNLPSSDKTIIDISNSFGTIIPDDNGTLIQYLKPKEKGSGITGSFSHNFGYSTFPFHTDTAFWSKPVRYIMMTSEKQNNCKTLLFDFNQIFSQLSDQDILAMKKAVFLLKTNSVQKFTSMIFREDKLQGIRYDPNIMSPINDFARASAKIIKNYLETQKTIKFEWTGNNVLLLDNWRLLHARENIINDKTRLLKRIYLNNSNNI